MLIKYLNLIRSDKDCVHSVYHEMRGSGLELAMSSENFWRRQSQMVKRKGDRTGCSVAAVSQTVVCLSGSH